MARSKSIDDYIAAQPETSRAVLGRVRAIIRKTLPDAEETISYGIPAYRQDGVLVIFFAGWKEHFSLYPAGERLVAAFGEAVAPYKISKGTIRFPLAEPVPAKLVERIVRFRASEAAALAKAKAAAPTKRKPARRVKVKD